MSLTIVSVFLPIAFVGGLIGKFLNSFGLVVSIAVLISLVEALTFAPMLSAYLFKQQKAKDRGRGCRGSGYRSMPAWAGSNAYTCARWIGRCATGWSRWRSASRSWRPAVYGATFLKQIFVPSIDQGSRQRGAARCRRARSLTQTDQKAREVWRPACWRWSRVKSVLTTVGGRGTPETARFHINLKEGHPIEEFLATARGELADVPGLSISGGSFTAMAARRLLRHGQADPDHAADHRRRGRR